MEGMKISSSKIRLAINDDENRIVVINPGNNLMRQRYYEVFEQLEKKGKEMTKKAKSLDPKENVKELLKLEEETFDFIAKKIDEVFGEGTVEKITEGDKDLDLLVQFFEGITPYFKKYNNDKMSKYAKGNKAKNGVMK